MYGKPKSERGSSKAHKREQIGTLLINKFRNKYHVNPTEEMDIDKLIQNEILNLLVDGSAYEAKLSQVDKKLDQMIKAMR